MPRPASDSERRRGGRNRVQIERQFVSVMSSDLGVRGDGLMSRGKKSRLDGLHPGRGWVVRVQARASAQRRDGRERDGGTAKRKGGGVRRVCEIARRSA